MGKTSKKSKVVHLTKIKPKGRELKLKLIQKARDLLEAFPTVFVFQYTNFSTRPFQQLRESFTNSKFLLGKAKILTKALGDSPAVSTKPNTHRLSAHLKGKCGLLFTRDSAEEIVAFFANWREEARLLPGQSAVEDIEIPAGTTTFKRLSSSTEPYLRKMGLPTKVNHGEIEVLADFKLCSAGNTLTAEQTRVMKVLGLKQGGMAMKLKGLWRDGEFKELS